MIDLELNSDHDISIVNGDLRLVRAEAAVPQHVKQRLLAILGEWFLDHSVGLPWFETILGKHRTLDVVEALIRDQILGTPGIKSLDSFVLRVDENAERRAIVTFTATLNSGESASLELSI